MTFAIVSMLKLKTQGIKFLSPFYPHALYHPFRACLTLTSNHQKDWTISSKEGVIGMVSLIKHGQAFLSNY